MEDDDPLVSAVVDVRPGAEHEGHAAENPAGVASEASAILQSGGPGTGVVPGRRKAPTDVQVPDEGSLLARAKTYFSRAGFEVHAPVGQTFSIGANKSLFEYFFGVRLVVDEERLGAPVRTADGDRELSLERLPVDVRAMVDSIYFTEPPDLPLGF